MIVNGEEVHLQKLEVKTLLELVLHYDLKPESIAVERNGQIPGREEWASIELQESDRIELIRFVGGG